MSSADSLEATAPLSASLFSSTSTPPQPPPPPPPPLPSSSQMNPETGMLLSFEPTIESNPKKLLQVAYNQFWRILKKNNDAEDGEKMETIISLYNHCEGILQSGPTCGLVAMMMALKLVKPELELSLDQVLLQVKTLNFSKFGEMFSVENMSALINKSYGISAQVKTHLERSIFDLVRHLCAGLPALVPYDADANYEPCLKDGERAHWATICGFCIVTDSKAAKVSLSVANETSIESWAALDDFRSIVHLQPSLTNASSIFAAVKAQLRKETLFLLTRQGKSRRVQVWNFLQLCQSNRNLSKVCSRILNHPERNQMIYPPDGDLSKSLANQFIFLYK